MTIEEVSRPAPATGTTEAPSGSLQGAGPTLGLVRRKLSAAGAAMTTFVLDARLHGHKRTAFAASMAASVVLVGVAYALGSSTSASADVFFMVPIVLVTIFVGKGFGVVVAAETAIAWVISDSLVPPPQTLATATWNGLLRFAVLSAVAILLGALRDALAQARSSDRRSKDFLSYAAHQVRTPVAGMRSCAESLIMSGVSEEQERLLAHLVGESERVGRMVGSMLELARLDHGAVFSVRSVDLTQLCRDQVDLSQRRAGSEIELRLWTEGQPNYTVLVSPEPIQEALANLLDNAVRHAQRRVDVTLSTSNREVEIAVSDDGPGLAQGEEGRAFERFVSLDGKGGVGMGLPIARALLEGQGGTLKYLQGRFVMRLPVDRTREPRPPPGRKPSRKMSRPA